MSTTTLAEVKSSGGAVGQPQAAPDFAIDMFTERGFALANRIAKAYASSDAVPAQFRLQVLKKVGRDEHWVENPNALGNCLVAIEVARAVGMSITAVMQNADMIEGKLRWSGKFVIAAINASGRFTPLRFQMVNRGRIKATYKEKTGWDNEARRPIFTDRHVEVDDIECIAWALPRGTPEPRPTAAQIQQYRGRLLDLYRDLGWPVIESAPVTMKMVVEEGWYGKPGSKWQTELRTLMFQYRAGSFFGNIHAPDIVMGMGRTAEEERDLMQTFDMGPDGTVSTVPLGELRSAAANVVEVVGSATPAAAASVVEADPETGEVPPPPAPAPEPKRSGSSSKPPAQPAFDADAFAERMAACKDVDALDLMADEIRHVENADLRETLNDVYRRRRDDLRTSPVDATEQRGGAAAAGGTQGSGAPATRRTRAAQSSIE